MTYIEEIFTNKISLKQVAVFVIVIAYNLGYVYLETETLNGSTIAYLEWSGGIKVIYPLALLAILMLSAYYHIRQHRKDLCDEFSAGYKESKSIQFWLCQKYPEFKNTPILGMAMGMIQGSLLNKTQDFGIIKKIGSGQQVKVSFRFDIKTHYSAVCNGIQRILCKKFPVYEPLILAIVAMLLIAVTQPMLLMQ